MTEPFRPTGVRRTAVTALAVVTGVLVAAAGLFVALYLMERADIREVDGKLAAIERELDGENDRLTISKSTVDGLDQARDDLDTEITGLRVCADPAKASIDAARTGDDAGLDAAFAQMFARCGR
jgi:hypothetical protein